MKWGEIQGNRKLVRRFVFLRIFVAFWRVRPSIRSSRRSRNTVVISGVLSKIVFFLVAVPILKAFLLPNASDVAQNVILTPTSKRILPQTIIFRSQGCSEEEKVQKKPPKGSVGKGRRINFFMEISFCNLGPALAPKSPTTR